MTAYLDDLVRSVSAYHDFHELVMSIKNHGYRPTIRPNHQDDELNRKAIALRSELLARGYPVYPDKLPEDHLPRPACIEVAAVEAEPHGFKQFNGGRHLCVDLPDGHYTIAARTSEGKVITFAFVPYKQGGPGQCCDIMFHNSGKTVDNGGDDLPVQKVIAFTPGSQRFVSSYDDDKPCTLTCVILQRDNEGGSDAAE